MSAAAETGEGSGLVFVPAYTVVLAANGVLVLMSALSLRSLARQPEVAAARWVFEFSAQAAVLLAAVSALVVFLRVRRSQYAPTATTILSAFLALCFPFGTASFLYWLGSVRRRERG